MVFRLAEASINQSKSFRIIFQTDPLPPLDLSNIKRTMFLLCSSAMEAMEAGMLKTFVEEAAALASITLFVGMVAVWAQLIPQL